MKLESQFYDEVFMWAKKKLETYPSSDALTLNWALFFGGRRVMDKVLDSESYDEYILQCFQRLLDSRDENIKSSAAESLYTIYFRKEQYEKAEEYLSYFSDRNPDKKRRLAEIYSKTHRIEEAYKAYEELLFHYYQMADLVFYGMRMLARQEEDQEKILSLIEKVKQLAKVFDRGEFIEEVYDLENIRDEETYAYMKSDKRWQELGTK